MTNGVNVERASNEPMTNAAWGRGAQRGLIGPAHTTRITRTAGFLSRLPGDWDGIQAALRMVMKRPYDIQDRSFLYATEIVDFCRPVMPPGAVVRELAKQLLRSGTSIGANLEEADAGQTKDDFRAKLSISRKEARETRYWLRLMAHADRRLQATVVPLIDESRQLIDILTTIKMNSERNDNRG